MKITTKKNVRNWGKMEENVLRNKGCESKQRK